MDAQERERLVGVIQSLAETITHSHTRAETSRIRLQNKHVAAESHERSKNLKDIEAEIESIE